MPRRPAVRRAFSPLGSIVRYRTWVLDQVWNNHRDALAGTAAGDGHHVAVVRDADHLVADGTDKHLSGLVVPERMIGDPVCVRPNGEGGYVVAKIAPRDAAREFGNIHHLPALTLDLVGSLRLLGDALIDLLFGLWLFDMLIQRVEPLLVLRTALVTMCGIFSLWAWRIRSGLLRLVVFYHLVGEVLLILHPACHPKCGDTAVSIHLLCLVNFLGLLLRRRRRLVALVDVAVKTVERFLVSLTQCLMIRMARLVIFQCPAPRDFRG